MKMTYIYSLSDPITNQVRYIGKSDNPIKRLGVEIAESKRNIKSHRNFWIKSLLRQELKPNIEVIDCVLLSDWQFWERHYISLYRSWNFDLVNSTDGGEGCVNYKHTVESRAKISKSHITSPRPCRSKQSLIDCGFIKSGRKKSKETIDKLRKSNSGNIPSKFTLQRLSEVKSKVVYQYDLHGNLLNKWKSMIDAANYYNMNYSGISRCCRGKNKTCAGYKWSYQEI